MNRRDLPVAGVTALAVLAATTAYARAFSDAAWGVPTLLAVLVATLVAVLVRASGGPAVVAAALQVVGLAAAVDLLFLPETASPLPGGALLTSAGREELSALVAEGFVLLREAPAPAEAVPALVVLVVVGTWLVSHLAHELAVRGGRPAAALPPAALLWLVPLAMPQPAGRTWTSALPFLLAAAVVLLVDADLELALRTGERRAPRLGGAGLGIGAVAVVLGLALPAALPGYGASSWLVLGDGQDPRGYQPIVDVGDRLTLPGDRDVLRVTTERPLYLRLAALDSFDGSTWRLGPPGDGSFSPDRTQLSDARDDIVFETSIAQQQQVRLDVEVLDLENIYVPVPYQPLRLSGPGASSMVYSQVGGFVATAQLDDNELNGRLTTGVVEGLRYSVDAAVPVPDPDALRAIEPAGSSVAPWLQLPGGAGAYERHGQLAMDVYAEAGAATMLDRVLALQAWFTREDRFRYSVSEVDQLRGPNGLDTFLFDSRVGYCEYFATAMAVMLRATDVPARVAVGFLPGEPVDDEVAADGRRTYVVSSSDSHAWVEVLFPGQGWIKFDPTPRGDGATFAPRAEDLDPLVSEADRLAEEAAQEDPDQPDDTTPDTPDEAVPDGPDLEALPDVPTTTGEGATDVEDDGSPVLPVLGVVALLGLGLGVVLVRRRRRADDVDTDPRRAVLDAQDRVLATGVGLGLPRRPAATVPEVLHDWAAADRLDAPTAARLAAAGQRAAFAPDVAGIDAERAVADGQRLVEQLREGATRADRLTAPVRPALVRARARAERLRDRI